MPVEKDIEIFWVVENQAVYDFPLLTIPLHWYVRGTERIRTIRIYYNRGKTEGDTLRGLGLVVSAVGDSPEQGKEIIERGFFSLKFPDSSEWTDMKEDTVFLIGDLSPNEYKDIQLRFSIPDETVDPTIETDGYAVFRLDLIGWKENFSLGSAILGNTVHSTKTYSQPCINKENQDIDNKLLAIIRPFVIKSSLASELEQVGFVFEGRS
ncbi:hypothetical protein J7M23_12875 [Candidatus Sumerlaeota bacterium]|nr:hypothetical protein [Candidatus Sumerlaeota bacterium]